MSTVLVLSVYHNDFCPRRLQIVSARVETIKHESWRVELLGSGIQRMDHSHAQGSMSPRAQKTYWPVLRWQISYGHPSKSTTGSNTDPGLEGCGRGSKAIGDLNGAPSNRSGTQGPSRPLNTLLPLPCADVCGKFHLEHTLTVESLFTRPQSWTMSITLWWVMAKRWCGS